MVRLLSHRYDIPFRIFTLDFYIIGIATGLGWGYRFMVYMATP